MKESPLAQAALITALLLLAYWLGPISFYETNDDVFYNLLLSGKLMANAPYAHTAVIDYLLSLVFVGLYTLFPGVSWYGLFHLAAIALAVFFLNYCYALTRGADKFFLRLAVSLACSLPFLFCLQFTKTACVLGVAGYLSLYLLNEAVFCSRRQILLLHAGSASLVVLSFCLRRQSFLLATILCGLLLVSALLKKKKALIISLSVVAALVLVFALVHRQNYDEDWQRSARLWEKLIGPILDYGHYDYDANKAVYDAAGWSRNDYYFLLSWGAFDSRIYSEEKIDYISSHAQKKPIERSLRPVLRDAVSFPASNYLLTAVGLATLMLLIFRQRYLSLCLFVLLPFALCVFYLAWAGRFPTRVSTGMAFFLPWAVLIGSGALRNRLFVTVVAVVTAGALAVPMYGQFQDLSVMARERMLQNQDLHRFGQAVSKQPITLITMGASFPYEGILPFEPVDYLSAVSIVWLNSFNQSPLQKQQMAANRIDDLFGALLKRNDVFIVIHPYVSGILKTYVYEHYRKNVAVTPAYSGMNFIVYRLVPSPG